MKIDIDHSVAEVKDLGDRYEVNASLTIDKNAAKLPPAKHTITFDRLYEVLCKCMGSYKREWILNRGGDHSFVCRVNSYVDPLTSPWNPESKVLFSFYEPDSINRCGDRVGILLFRLTSQGWRQGVRICDDKSGNKEFINFHGYDVIDPGIAIHDPGIYTNLSYEMKYIFNYLVDRFIESNPKE